MIISAISLWKKLDLDTPLCPTERFLGTDANGASLFRVTFNGRKTEDGGVRISALFARPSLTEKTLSEKLPTVVFLPDLTTEVDGETIAWFTQKGYAVFIPDYAGQCSEELPTEDFATAFVVKKPKKAQREATQIVIPFADEKEKETGAKAETNDENSEPLPYTVYPPSLFYANAVEKRGFLQLGDYDADRTCWFEWLGVVANSVRYLSTRADVSGVGVVGVRVGGDLAWKSMLSPLVKCGIPINAVGWDSLRNSHKYSESAGKNQTDERHRYIAGIESQSYAKFVTCPVLVVCSTRDPYCDYDRAYDTVTRIGYEDGNALVYSADSGPCVGSTATFDMQLFLEKNLKGREIYLPESLSVTMTEDGENLAVDVEVDVGGILEEAGVCYAESGDRTKSIFRNWQTIGKVAGKTVKDGKFRVSVKPFEGASYAFAYAYARYINGFEVCSRVAFKKLKTPSEDVQRTRMLFDGTGLECFDVYRFEDYADGDLFLEREALPKTATGYGGIVGAYSVSGLKTYKISSPQCLPSENAVLKFDLYAKSDDVFGVFIEVDDGGIQTYASRVAIKGGGKWKRIVLKPEEFKCVQTGLPLASFAQGSSLSFLADTVESECLITNVLWL